VYRAVGHAEYEDIQITGRFRPAEGMMEGKWFADTYEGSLLHAASLYPDGNYRIVAADLPNDLLQRLYRPGDLDRFGPATYLESHELARIAPVLEFKSRDC
jgi:hypothetical protein